MSELEEALDWALNQIDGKTRYDNANQYHACRKRAEDCLQALRSTDPQWVVEELVSAAEAVVCEWDDINSPDVDCTGFGGLPPEPDSPAMGRLRTALSSISLRSAAEVKAEGAREERERLIALLDDEFHWHIGWAASDVERIASWLRSQSSEGEV